MLKIIQNKNELIKQKIVSTGPGVKNFSNSKSVVLDVKNLNRRAPLPKHPS